MNHLILPAIHLIALIAFITYKTKTPFIQFMKKRYQEVYEGLNRAKIQAAEAEARKKEVESKLKTLDAEKDKISAEWKERKEQQIKALQESSARVISQMKAESEQNKKALEHAFGEAILKNFSKTVLQQSEAKIKQALNPETLAKLNQNFTQEISRAPESTRGAEVV